MIMLCYELEVVSDCGDHSEVQTRRHSSVAGKTAGSAGGGVRGSMSSCVTVLCSLI